ncbi:hypothetical protein LTR37_013543 [Vermiconidia calcicola]|uniref:Uncharacterized protein n=1 Tax=Vermiconidia calcicola TaxID=1690605 RepID=A0ACC3MXJ4_9PEZI|nr:hypothetical protein LTR37_013543 [Vermiconidia calcicola]
MPTGTCICGAIKIAYTGSPTYIALCHCNDDRKMSNVATYQVPEEAFTLAAGEPRVYTMVSDFGREIRSHFCATCGTTLYRTGGTPNVKGMIGIRAGVLDDQSILDESPKIEVFVERRPKWMGKIEGAVQLNAKYEIVDEGGRESRELTWVVSRSSQSRPDDEL